MVPARLTAASCAALLAALTVYGTDISDTTGTSDGDVCGGAAGARGVALTAVTADSGAAPGEALSSLLRAALRARGVRARVAPAPAECARAAVSAACAAAVLRALSAGELHAAVLPLPAARPPHVLRLRDHGLEPHGDVAPPARLLCGATRAGARPLSLLDLTDETLAARYEHTRAPAPALCTAHNGSEYEYVPPWCARGRPCGTLLTGAEYEARELQRVVLAHHLRLRVLALGECLVHALAALGPRPTLVCTRDRALLTAPLAPLAPPPCAGGDAPDVCVFDPYRLVKLINARQLAHSPAASGILGRVTLTSGELHELAESVRGGAVSAEGAVRAALGRHRSWVTGGEVRVAVMIPVSSTRETYDGRALSAAATLAELDAPRDDEEFEFKVEVLDDGCDAALAFKYLTDAPTAELGALSGVAGPACSAAFADVARQSPALRLPVLAYTPQAPPPDGELALLAAGDARLHTHAWAALAAHMGWRRIAVLSELATRATLDVTALGVDVLAHVELTNEGTDVDLQQINQWARRAAGVRARVLLVCVEDARVVRAALCAGRGVALTPREGAVWLLPGALPAGWTRRGARDTHACTEAQLRDMYETHISVTEAWRAHWTRTDAARDWSARWRAQCARTAGALDQCVAPDAHAAALYDTLRLWRASLTRLLRRRPATLDDLHCNNTVRELVRDAAATNYSGLTGDFQWGAAGPARARAAPLLLRQWRAGEWRLAARWRRGAPLTPPALTWLTPDGRAPDDGAERCALQPLADVLRADCRVAFVALGTLLLLLLAAALGAAAYRCKQRAERDYRRRLAALGLRDLSPAPGLDRWEIPRERVVINRKLGTGAFGTVYGGHALLAEGRGWSAVAVKTLKAGGGTEEKLDFLSEAETMKRFDHKNVVRLLGVVTKTEPVCTVMEFMLYGDLKSYLLARRHLAAGAGDEAGEVSAARLSAMALDAARGLSYLAQRRYVHRDVAARNCLVSARRVVKLADFGMARPVFDSDYYRFSRKGMLPVRWMAPESLALGVFSTASDVWSFGVLLYEIVTFGSLPFQGLSNAEVLARVKAGRALELPDGLQPQLAGLIKSCWSTEYKARPGAAEVAAFLSEWPRLLEPCLDVPLDALTLDSERDAPAPWDVPQDRAQARWVSWGSPASATTDTTYLSTDAPPPSDTDSFLP